MPLREALAVVAAGRIALPVCGGCGHLLSRPVPHRSPQEV
jgi:hypothetical protein